MIDQQQTNAQQFRIFSLRVFMPMQLSYLFIIAISIYSCSYSMQENQLTLGNDYWSSMPTEVIANHIINIKQETPELTLKDMINMGRCAPALYQKIQPIITEYLGYKHIALRRKLTNKEKALTVEHTEVIDEISKKPWYKSYFSYNTAILNQLEPSKDMHIQLQWPADPYRLFDINKKTLLHCAVASVEQINHKLYKNMLEIISYLATQYPSTINLQDLSGNTPLMCSTTFDVHTLLKDRTDLSLKNRANLTAYEKILQEPNVDKEAFITLYTKSLPIISEEPEDTGTKSLHTRKPSLL